MLRCLILCFSLLFVGLHAQAQERQSADTLLDIVASPEPIPYADRQAAKQAPIARPYNEVLPGLARRITQCPPEWSARMKGNGVGSGLGDEHSTPGEQAIWALNQIWAAQTYGAKAPTFPADLVRYLNDAAFYQLRGRLVGEISAYWCAEALKPITRIFNDFHEPVSLRCRAADALMHHARDENLDSLLDFAQALPTQDASLPPAARVAPNMTALEQGLLAQYTPCRPRDLAQTARHIAEIHSELLLIHPFREGNGRLADLMADLMAAQAGLPTPDYRFRGRGSRQERMRYLAAVKQGYLMRYDDLTGFFRESLTRGVGGV